MPRNGIWPGHLIKEADALEDQRYQELMNQEHEQDGINVQFADEEQDTQEEIELRLSLRNRLKDLF